MDVGRIYATMSRKSRFDQNHSLRRGSKVRGGRSKSTGNSADGVCTIRACSHCLSFSGFARHRLASPTNDEGLYLRHPGFMRLCIKERRSSVNE
jgi:hypothetical protein